MEYLWKSIEYWAGAWLSPPWAIGPYLSSSLVLRACCHGCPKKKSRTMWALYDTLLWFGICYKSLSCVWSPRYSEDLWDLLCALLHGHYPKVPKCEMTSRTALGCMRHFPPLDHLRLGGQNGADLLGWRCSRRMQEFWAMGYPQQSALRHEHWVGFCTGFHFPSPHQ